MDEHEQVLQFIDCFTKGGKRQDVIEAFTNGCCYWFAQILQQRFLRFGTEILYDHVDGHFATRIGDCVYDITGDITDEVHSWDSWFDWERGDDNSLSGAKRAVIRDCVMMKRLED